MSRSRRFDPDDGEPEDTRARHDDRRAARRRKRDERDGDGKDEE